MFRRVCCGVRSGALLRGVGVRFGSSLPADGKRLQDFVPAPGALSSDLGVEDAADEWWLREGMRGGERYWLETYGCQMNVADSEIVETLLRGAGWERAESERSADWVFLNTCAIRENAEQRVRGRLRTLRSSLGSGARLGVLGCMAERLKERLLSEERVDLVAGPDAYRRLPALVQEAREQGQAADVKLSPVETYAGVVPTRAEGEPRAFVSIMRGCANMCSFCVVPFTRGRERSSAAKDVVEEAQRLRDAGVREIVLLGQNVNSYHDKNGVAAPRWAPLDYQTSAPEFQNLFRSRGGPGVHFPDLLDRVSEAVPEARIRFTSPHPKDFPLPLLELIAERANIAKQLHLPAQSGSNPVLQSMRRLYSREAFLDLVERARATIPGVALSTDMIAGFCGETQEDHDLSVDLLAQAKFDQAFLFAYSLREKTRAHRRMQDDVPQHVKAQRLQELIATYHKHAIPKNEALLHSTQQVLLTEPHKGVADCGRWMHFEQNAGQVGTFITAKVIATKGARTLHGVALLQEE